MTAGTHSIDHPAHRHARRPGAHRIASMMTMVSRRPRAVASIGSHAGQLGPRRETELGRLTGARI
jgi:hypothetical protein